jgi:hypothetical protein
MNRRDILKGGLVAGAALALPARAFSQSLPQSLTDEFDKAFGHTVQPGQPAPLAPAVPPLPTTLAPNPAYDRKVLEIA